MRHAQGDINALQFLPDTAVISFTTPTRPAVLTGKREDGPADYRYVLMPIRSAV